MPPSEYIKNIRAKIGKDLLLLPGVTAIVINKRGEILLQLRRDTRDLGATERRLGTGRESGAVRNP